MKTMLSPLLCGALVATGFFHAGVALGAPPVNHELAPMTVQGHGPGTPGVTGETDTPKATFAELIEEPVYNYQNERLGRVKAITADLEQGRLVEVLVATRSGFMDLHEKLTPVPPTLLKLENATQTLRLNVSRARFEAAQGLTRGADARTFSDAGRALAASRYFGVRPWFEHGGLGYVVTTGALDLLQIKDPQGHYMGRVGLVMMDLPNGRIRQIVDDTETMHGDGSFVLAPTALRWNARHTGLVLRENFARLSEGAHFRWVHGNGNDTQFVLQTNAGALAGRERAAE